MRSERNFAAQNVAVQLKYLIETQSSPVDIEQQTQLLISHLGGNPNLISTSPGAATLYLVALMLS